MTREQQNQIKSVIEFHSKHKGAYFWTPPSSASARKRMTQTLSGEVTVDGDCISWSCSVDCSCKHVRYTSAFKLNGVKKNIRLLKSLIK